MTLFKKVFGNETVGTPRDHGDAALEEDLDAFDEVDSDIGARLATVAERKGALSEDHPETPEVEEDEQPFAEGEEGSDDTEETDDHNPEPGPEMSKPETSHEPTLAERAAEAHRQMQMSQGRTVTRKGVSRPATASMEAKKPTSTGRMAAPEADPPATDEVPQPVPRAGRRARTRLLGFSDSDDVQDDPFARAATATGTRSQKFPVGWFVITDGPGRGNWFAVFDGVSTIGRGEDQTIMLDFGDSSISRQNHATFAYDNEQNSYYLGHGGKSNIIRLNDLPVLSTEEMTHADTIRIGETTLRFVAMCGDDFRWRSV